MLLFNRNAFFASGLSLLLTACGGASNDNNPNFPRIQNGSFESGDFSNWITQDLSEPFGALEVLTEIPPLGLDPVFKYSEPLAPRNEFPSDGSYGAYTGFDGNGGPGNDRIFVAQDVDLSGHSKVAISFDWAVTLCQNGGEQERIFSLEIEPQGGGASLFSETIYTCIGGIIEVLNRGEVISGTNIGGNDQVIDISSVSGQAVRIKFQWLVPQVFTGPAAAFLDDVKLFEPSSPAAASASIVIESAINGEIADTSPGPLMVPGSLFNLSYQVGNTGTETLVDIFVYDDASNWITCPEDRLLPRQGMTCIAQVFAPIVPDQYPIVGTVIAGREGVMEPVTDTVTTYYEVFEDPA